MSTVSESKNRGVRQNRWSAFFRRRGSPFLMWLLVAETLASPAVDAHPKVGALLALIVLAGILIGASFTGNRRIIVSIGIPISGLWLAARLLEEFGNGKHIYDHLAHFFGLALSCTIFWALSDHLGRANEVTSNLIAEAIISYLIIAIAFSQLYWIVNDFAPDSFRPPLRQSESSAFLYFSMITLTSVGYGEIIPLNPYLRLMAAFETVAGTFYLAVVVSRLVASLRPRSLSGAAHHEIHDREA